MIPNLSEQQREYLESQLKACINRREWLLNGNLHTNADLEELVRVSHTATVLEWLLGEEASPIGVRG